MGNLPPIRALIFDFDGVLADTEDLHWAAFCAVAAGDGLSLPRQTYYDRYLGLTDRACLEHLYAEHGRLGGEMHLDELVIRKRRAFAVEAQAVTLYPGVAESLRRWHASFLIAVASGAFRDEIEPILRRADVLPLFAAVVGAEDVRAGKPAPDPFLCALERLNRHASPILAAAECVVVEDSRRGIEAARAAGMRVVAVATNHSLEELAEADAVVAETAAFRPEDLRT